MSEPVKWNEMTARERDALVAEKVMGWTMAANGLPEGSPYTNRDGNLRGMNVQRVPLYTISFAAAWRVVEEMAGDGWSMAVWNDGRVEVTREDDNAVYLQVDGPTAPEAICIAALRACGVEVVT